MLRNGSNEREMGTFDRRGRGKIQQKKEALCSPSRNPKGKAGHGSVPPENRRRPKSPRSICPGQVKESNSKRGDRNFECLC